jgi:ABC-type phosphate transport system substrate-binding protein
MKIKNISLLLASIFSLMLAQSVLAGVSVVVNPNNSLDSANQTEVVNLFLNKSKTLQGERLTPVDQSKGQTARTEFYDVVVRKNESQLKAYWSRLIFTGKGLPPVEVGNDKSVLNRVAGDPNAIGYVSSDKVTSAVKVIATF